MIFYLSLLDACTLLCIASALISQILLPSSKFKSHLVLVLSLAVYPGFAFSACWFVYLINHVFNLTKVILPRKELPVPKHLRGQHVMYLITVISM